MLADGAPGPEALAEQAEQRARVWATLGRLDPEQRVAVVPGEGFAAPGYLRISFARPMEDLREGVKRLATFLESLREG